MYIYRVVASTDRNGAPTFGLALYDGDSLLRVMPGLSTDRPGLERLARLFTKEQVAPVHMEDVVEDMVE